MDAIELGRQFAAQLHATVVSEGCDPWDPIAIVRAAAARNGITEITALKPGSASLSGARASFDPQSRSILHEDTGDSFQNAFLIGHELGHAALGDDQTAEASCDPDLSRSAEAAPEGEERVAGYSGKSRREVQMDLFARELLMPRSFVRAQHLGGMTAANLAARFSAPFDAVAQQLLDALLLPTARPDELPTEAPALNEGQQRAATCDASAFLLEAGPGTGKTKTLVGRVCALVERGVDPRGIVVLTYSNRAAGELATRIAAHLPQAAAAMWIGTFHAYGLNIVRLFHRALGFESEPRLLDRTEAIELMLDRLAGLNLRHYRDLYDPTDKFRDLLAAISRAQDEAVTASRYGELIDAMASTDHAPEVTLRLEKAREVWRVYESYSRAKIISGRVDFGDLVALPTLLLEQNSEIASQVRETISDVVVDEYQDVNRASIRLLQQLVKDKRRLWCVGDIRQSIYRFRGASSFNLERFETADFPGGRRDQLNVNYRSRAEIVDTFSSFAALMPVSGATPIKVDVNRGPSGHPCEFQWIEGDREREIDAVVDAIEALRKEGIPYRDQVVLCSGNDRLAETSLGLEARGLPVLFLGSLFERPEVKDLLAWLSLLVDRRAMGLARKTSLTEFPLSLGDIGLLAERQMDEDTRPLDWLNSPPANLSRDGQLAVKKYAELFVGLDTRDHPWALLAKLLLDRSRIAAEIASADRVAHRARGIAIWQLMNFVRAQKLPPFRGIGMLLERIRRLVRLSDDRELRHIPHSAIGIDAVRLMTMHGSKGLEFRAVHIPGMTKGTLPRRGPADLCPPPDGMIEGAGETGELIAEREHGEEQECLFYVALSRARDRLFLYSPNRTRQSEGGSSSARNPSPFIERLNLRGPVQPMAPISSHVIDEEVAVDIRRKARPMFTQDQLGLYERCPRRFLYAHILNLGGRRRTTAYEDMHDVVRVVIADVMSGDHGPLDQANLVARLEIHWAASPLAKLTWAGPAYRQLADELLGHFMRRRQGAEKNSGAVLALPLKRADIHVTFDERLSGGKGAMVLRQIRTGHRPKTAWDGVSIAAGLIAAQHASKESQVEVLYLSDEEPARLALTGRVLENRRVKLSEMIDQIMAGKFPTKPSSRTCPKCPAFFTCGSLPEGHLQK